MISFYKSILAIPSILDDGKIFYKINGEEIFVPIDTENGTGLASYVFDEHGGWASYFEELGQVFEVPYLRWRKQVWRDLLEQSLEDKKRAEYWIDACQKRIAAFEQVEAKLKINSKDS